MKRERLLTRVKIDNAIFNTQQLYTDEGRHIFKLLSTVKTGNFFVTCKYKEYNEMLRSTDGRHSYSSLKYLVAIQIKIVTKSKHIKTYELHSFSNHPHMNSITVTYNSNSFKIVAGSAEFEEFQNILNDLTIKLDEFSINFIETALEDIISENKISQTPKCVEEITKRIEDMKCKQTLIK